MIINSSTIGATEGGIKIFLDGEEAYGVVNVWTKQKFAEKYVRDDKGNLVVQGDELAIECVSFSTARVEFDNVIIEVR